MKVSELIYELSKMPQSYEVEFFIDWDREVTVEIDYIEANDDEKLVIIK